MAALLGPPPKVVWLRSGNRPRPAIEETLRRHHALLLDFARSDDAACLELR
jgi:predicted nuclease of predicted toxin-antitoxin system